MNLRNVVLPAGLGVGIVLAACSHATAVTGGTTGATGGAGTGAETTGPSASTTGAGGQGGTGTGAGGGDAGAPDAAGETTPGLTKVGTGEYETFYLKDGVIYAYGGGSATLGLGSYQGISIPPRPIATPAGLKFLDVQGGLHQSMAIDENHKVWTWGDTSAGLSGSGMTGLDPTTPYQITTDSKGNPFDDVAGIQPTTNFNAALKADGTVWVWGNCAGGVTGDGTMSGEVDKPTQVPIPLPSGVTIKKISGAAAMLAYASDGSVWSWGPAEDGVLGTGNTADGTVPRKVIDLPADIVDVAAGGADFFYALTSAGELYGWGYRNAYLGMKNAPGPSLTPVSLATVLDLPKPVKTIVADSLGTHAILTDGTLWGWGDAACGSLGNGEEPDWTPKGCGWDFMAYDDMVYAPVQIVPGVSNFSQIFANTAYDFYVYALTADGKLYSWGRNKTGTLGNGVYPGAANGQVGTASDIAANHANSWDVPTATLVTPFTTPPNAVLSPCCPATDPDAGGCM